MGADRDRRTPPPSLALLGEVRAELDALIGAVADGSRDRLGALLDRGVAGTRAIPGKHGGPARPTRSVFVSVPDHPGELARLFADAGASEVNIEDIHIDHDPGRPVGLVELVVDEARAEHLLAVSGIPWMGDPPVGCGTARRPDPADPGNRRQDHVSASPADLVVAVDGTSGSGKSSTSRGVAARLGLRYLDTGAMFRAMTWWMLRAGRRRARRRRRGRPRVREPRSCPAPTRSRPTIIRRRRRRRASRSGATT